MAYTLGLQPRLAGMLRSAGVQLEALDDRLAVARPIAESYLEIAEFILQQAQIDPPAALIVPGNPLQSNAICRFIVMRAQQRKLRVQTLPGISPIDALVSITGLDVGTFGLQVFDARRLVQNAQRVDAGVPLLLLEPAGLVTPAAVSTGGIADTAFEALVAHLGTFYPPDHAVAHLSDGTTGHGPQLSSAPLDRFAELVPRIRPGSTLFMDRVRKRAPITAAASG
jgi:hypothetical protein